MARTRNQGSKWIRPAKRVAIYLRDGMACAYCGLHLEAGIVLTLDHVVPCELGGSNEASNLITACLSCNSSKQDRPLGAFLATLLDRGVDVAHLGERITAHTARDLAPFLVAAKASLAARGESVDE
jgi:5-methylcytosine-specific restriction endonuclease McrA